MANIAAKQVEAIIMGVAVGDALGVPAEFQQRGTFTITDMVGFGTHNQPPGTWSDDTSLTLCLADSLSRGFDLNDIARNFIKWYDKCAFTAHETVFDIGISTSKAINRLKAGVAPEKAGCAGANQNGNGSLMRTAPLVFYLADKPEAERYALTKAVSSITHAHPVSVASCFFHLEYLLKLLGGMDKDAAYAQLCAEFREGKPHISNDTLGRFARLLRDIRLLPESAIKSSGFVIDTLEAAFWCFLTTDSYRNAVLKAVNLGEDTDTTAAVTGALAGLYYGFDERGIPSEWIRKLARFEDIFAVADSLVQRFR
ncbi:MAG: ADP-ribosylglycohydrolase family protein [Spirochaetaceae bacterium]|jgi:ADP-ribosylglycohydrolase|nr:ADP-ribosylglycohydrolase family protein [Spirochaetaceae bacterium]